MNTNNAVGNYQAFTGKFNKAGKVSTEKMKNSLSEDKLHNLSKFYSNRGESDHFLGNILPNLMKNDVKSKLTLESDIIRIMGEKIANILKK